MAKFVSSATDSVFKIEKFLGVNECPDGDVNLKMGEASNMQNFKITDNGALQLRGGTANVAGLLSAYSITVSDTAAAVRTDDIMPTSTFTAYPTISVSTGGVLTLSGEAVTVDSTNIGTYVGYYWKDSVTGLIYQIGTVSTQASVSGAISVPGGYVVLSSTTYCTEHLWGSYPAYPNVIIYENAVAVSGTQGVISANNYMKFKNKVYKITQPSTPGDPNGLYDTYGYIVSNATQYVWKFYPVTATTNSNDTTVRGIWSGYVGCVEYIVAACNGYLWSLTESGGIWTKTGIGTVSTTSHVHMFGFDNKLYILDGTQYRVWNGTTLSNVAGYRPLVLHATTPAGSGATFEGINKLNGLRRVRFSPDGTATTFQLPEKGLTSVDYVEKTADGSAVTFTADVATGIVTITPALTSGTDALEIGYTFPTTQRAAVIGMKYSETYNGQTDTRVFLYGDGSNKAFYTGIQFNTGKPSAEYFPDFNEIAVDKANSPITAMIKHYDRLLTFKTDGAFITTYGTITDAQNNTLAAFYTTPLNREIGNVAVGQAKLVKNNPFTLFGRSVYEWQLSSFSAKDERNAKRKSDRVSETLAGMTLTDAFCFDDEFHTEYYVVQGGTAVVYNYTTDAWYIYKNFPAVCMITYKQEVYFGTEDGYIRHVSRNYMNDNGAPIEAYWESGSMDFGAPHKRKYSRGLWLGIKPETSGEIKVTAITDKTSNLNEELSASVNTQTSASGFFSFLDLDFTTLSFGVSDMPRIDEHKIKAKKFTYYKLIFSSANDNTTATVTNAEIAVRYTSNVR